MQIDLKKLKENNFESEEHFQAFCIKMISQEFPKLRNKVWHTQNEQHIPKLEGESEYAYKQRCQIIGNQNKAKGKLAGVMDILILFNGILYKIELKQPKGELTKSQEELHPIWNNDCIEIPVVVYFTPYEVYMYCKWICQTNLKINFQPDFKPFTL